MVQISYTFVYFILKKEELGGVLLLDFTLQVTILINT